MELSERFATGDIEAFEILFQQYQKDVYVSPSGKIIGVEISPESGKNVRNRAAINAWKNVEVIESNALEVRLKGSFDGLLMFAAAEIYASNEASENILPHLSKND